MTSEPQLKQQPRTDEDASESDLPNRLVGLLGLLLLGGIGTFLLAPFLLFWMGTSHREVVLEEASPDGAYRLSIKSSAAWGYGSHGIFVYQNAQGSRRQVLLETDLHNDGANLSPRNIQLTWQNANQAMLRLEGEEQDPACHLLTLGKAPLAEDVPCSATGDEAEEPAELLPESPVVLGP